MSIRIAHLKVVVFVGQRCIAITSDDFFGVGVLLRGAGTSDLESPSADRGKSSLGHSALFSAHLFCTWNAFERT
jgi:hypothetical protein